MPQDSFDQTDWDAISTQASKSDASKATDKVDEFNEFAAAEAPVDEFELGDDNLYFSGPTDSWVNKGSTSTLKGAVDGNVPDSTSVQFYANDMGADFTKRAIRPGRDSTMSLGMRDRQDTVATMRLVQSPKLDSANAKELSETIAGSWIHQETDTVVYNRFTVQNLQFSDSENIQVFQGQRESVFLESSARGVRTLQLSGTLLNSTNFEWFNTWLRNYDRVFRASKSIRERVWIDMVVDGVVYSGYIVSMTTGQNSIQWNTPAWNMSMVLFAVQPAPDAVVDAKVETSFYVDADFAMRAITAYHRKDEYFHGQLPWREQKEIEEKGFWDRLLAGAWAYLSDPNRIMTVVNQLKNADSWSDAGEVLGDYAWGATEKGLLDAAAHEGAMVNTVVHGLTDSDFPKASIKEFAKNGTIEKSTYSLAGNTVYAGAMHGGPTARKWSSGTKMFNWSNNFFHAGKSGSSLGK